jgi:hypothetical protein
LGLSATRRCSSTRRSTMTQCCSLTCKRTNTLPQLRCTHV